MEKRLWNDFSSIPAKQTFSSSSSVIVCVESFICVSGDENSNECVSQNCCRYTITFRYHEALRQKHLNTMCCYINTACVDVRVFMHARVHTYVRARVSTCMHASVTCVCERVCVWACTRVCVWACVCVSARACMCVFVCASVYLHVC